jgi:hypothetical protein
MNTTVSLTIAPSTSTASALEIVSEILKKSAQKISKRLQGWIKHNLLSTQNSYSSGEENLEVYEICMNFPDFLQRLFSLC